MKQVIPFFFFFTHVSFLFNQTADTRLKCSLKKKKKKYDWKKTVYYFYYFINCITCQDAIRLGLHRLKMILSVVLVQMSEPVYI